MLLELECPRFCTRGYEGMGWVMIAVISSGFRLCCWRWNVLGFFTRDYESMGWAMFNVVYSGFRPAANGTRSPSVEPFLPKNL